MSKYFGLVLRKIVSLTLVLLQSRSDRPLTLHGCESASALLKYKEMKFK